MADNTDELPLFIPQLPVQFMQDKVIVGEGNTVGATAQNVIVNGANNYVGDYCDNINLLNCSGCIVEPYTSGVIMLGSSGVITNNSGDFYLNNNKLTPSGDVISDPILIDADYTATISDNFILIITAGVTVTFPTYEEVGGKEWRIKNVSGGDAYIYTASNFGFDNESPVVNTITLVNNDAYTLKAYYIWILIL